MSGNGPAGRDRDQIAEQQTRAFMRAARHFADPAPDILRVISQMEEEIRLDPELPLLAFDPFATLPLAEAGTAGSPATGDAIAPVASARGIGPEHPAAANPSGAATRSRSSAGSLTSRTDGALLSPSASEREQPPVFSLRRTPASVSPQTSALSSWRASSLGYPDDLTQESGAAPPARFSAADAPLTPDGAHSSLRSIKAAGDPLGDHAPGRSAEQPFHTLHSELQTVARQALGLVDFLADAVLAQDRSRSPLTPGTQRSQPPRPIHNAVAPAPVREAATPPYANPAPAELLPDSAGMTRPAPMQSGSASPPAIETLSPTVGPGSPLEPLAATEANPSSDNDVASPMWLDPDEIIAVVTRALYEQARRHGVDLS